MNLRQIHTALISVSDKTGLVEFARALEKQNIRLISTGGTLSALTAGGIKAASITEVTGFPEILDGRVKTLHPKIHGGLLAVAGNQEHDRQTQELGIEPIDMVVVNLYPFEETVARPGVTREEAVEQIDVGGPSMIRAAAKNYQSKAVVTSPAQYDSILAELGQYNGALSGDTRFRLAQEAFLRTANYDAAIAGYFAKGQDNQILPDTISISLRKGQNLRYGENPHQQGAVYGEFLSIFEQLHGKELSYNNIVDVHSAVLLVEEFEEPTVVIVKHNNPCGVGSGATLAEAYEKAFSTDTKSAYGGIIAVNRPLDAGCASCFDRIFTEVIIAPAFSSDALELLKKKKDRRLLLQRKQLNQTASLMMRTIPGGMLVQTEDALTLDRSKLKTVTKRAPTAHEMEGMMFAWKVAKHVKSNAIVYALRDRTVGIGAGQMSRFDSSKIARMKAGEMGLGLKGSSVASDAFFPFADGLLEAVDAGATAVIQPGGSIRDAEVIAAADQHDVAMVFTGIRHFRH